MRLPSVLIHPDAIHSVNILNTVMGKLGVECLLVTDADNDTFVKGKITAMDIVKYYSASKENDRRFSGPLRTKRWMVYTKQVIKSRK